MPIRERGRHGVRLRVDRVRGEPITAAGSRLARLHRAADDE
jgi:hypothetical protein